MNQKMNFIPLFLGVAFMAHGVAYAGSCDSVEREMVQGQTAVEFAKEQNGYQKAVRLFEKATEKAPGCANAYYNLGLVYEKTTDYTKAKKALEKYLQLSPKAKDAAVVRKQIYRLEFIIANNNEAERKKSDLQKNEYWLKNTVGGTWIAHCAYANGDVRPTEVWHFTVSGDRVKYKYTRAGLGSVDSGAQDGMKFNFENNRFSCAEGFDIDRCYISVRSRDLMEWTSYRNDGYKQHCTFTRR